MSYSITFIKMKKINFYSTIVEDKRETNTFDNFSLSVKLFILFGEIEHKTTMSQKSILFIQMGGTIDKDYPRTKLGYSFEIGPPAIEPILQKIKPSLNFAYQLKTVCQKDSQELTETDRYLVLIKEYIIEYFISYVDTWLDLK